MSDPFPVLLRPIRAPEAVPAPAAPAQAAPAPVDPVQAEMAAKAALEARMAANPADPGLRRAYFDALTNLAGRHSGLIYAVLPELHAPLWFRSGTPDITALSRVFRDPQPGPAMRATPQRILVIGAHAGYAAVDLARRHPRAALLCVEPLADNFRLLTLNTQPWRRIRITQTALWHGSTALAPLGRLQSDWTVRLTDEALDADRTIAAVSPGELLARAGWSHIDMVVCDASGAEREIFADPLAAWLNHIDVALVRQHPQLVPDGEPHVAACFPADTFEAGRHDDMALYHRRTPLTALPALPPDVPLISGEPGPSRFGVQNVAPHPWAFFVFEGVSCQLHPNGVGAEPPRLVVPMRLAGHRRLISGLHHAAPQPSPPVVFRARLLREDGNVLAEAAQTVHMRQTGRLSVELPQPYHGPAVAVLETEMAPDMPDNRAAWARFIEPRVVG